MHIEITAMRYRSLVKCPCGTDPKLIEEQSEGEFKYYFVYCPKCGAKTYGYLNYHFAMNDWAETRCMRMIEYWWKVFKGFFIKERENDG